MWKSQDFKCPKCGRTFNRLVQADSVELCEPDQNSSLGDPGCGAILVPCLSAVPGRVKWRAGT